MLRVIGDREVAREAARINVSALLVGQSRIVPVEGRFAADRFTDAIQPGANWNRERPSCWQLRHCHQESCRMRML
jgi:hypothetical protein